MSIEAAERAFEPAVSTGVARLAAMDGLRGIAILLVLWFHVWQISWYGVALPFGQGIFDLETIPETGFIGVELFFFLSGFCVFYPYAKAHFEGRKAPTWRHFYLRRFLKIVPSYVLAIVVLVAFGYQHYAAFADAARDIGFHLLFVHNWFAKTTGSIDGVLWSLGVEVQFYILFPLLCLVFLRRPVVSCASLIALAMAFRTIVEHRDHYFFDQLTNQLPAVLDLFAVGMLVAYLYPMLLARRPSIARSGWWTAAAAAALVAVGVFLHSLYGVRYEHDGFALWQSHYRTGLALAFGVLGLGTLFSHRAWLALLANPVTIFLGAISYNLYIWHQVVARVVGSRLHPVTADPHDDPHWQVMELVLGSICALIVATVVTFGFERPILALGRRRFQSPLKPRAKELA